MTLRHDTPVIAGLGEVLWDMLPGGKRLGGAPANFAVSCAALGADSVLASSTGDDELGREARALLQHHGVRTEFLQTSREPTSRVLVELDDRGQASYTIEQPVAWDTLEWTPEWQSLAGQVSAVCYGTLGQRDGRSRAAIRAFASAAGTSALRVFDVNLRAPYWTEESIHWGLDHCSIVKVNEHELPLLLQSHGLAPNATTGAAHAERLDARRLLEALPGASMVCVTLGERGSLLVTADQESEHAGYPVTVVDTVGAGDAFTAAMTWFTLAGAPLEGVNAAANRLGSYVASQAGAMPGFPEALKAELRSLAGL